MEREPVIEKRRSRRPVFVAALVLLAVTAAVAMMSSADLRRTIGWTRVHPGYEWLHSGLDQANRSAELAFTSSRRQAVRGAVEVLHSAILYSRASARGGGTEPLPEQIEEDLAAFFPADTLRKVRWTIATNRLDLGSAVGAWYRNEGGAVTLYDTIVFSDRMTASDIVLWAHELTHVLQFEQLGVRDFAKIYVVNSATLEEQARINAGRITRRLRTSTAHARTRPDLRAGRAKLIRTGL